MTGNGNDRLKADYRAMLEIQNRPYLTWIVTKGELPYAEEYLLTVRLCTYVLSAERGRYLVSTVPACTVLVTLRDSYPAVAPYIRMLTQPPVFHPDWYSKGTYCASAPWSPALSLKDFVLRMLATLRWEPDVMNTQTPANYKALEWYLRRRDNAALFPCDPTPLTLNTPDELAAVEQCGREIIDSWGRESL